MNNNIKTIFKELCLESLWFKDENNLKTGYVEIEPLEFQKESKTGIPGLFDSETNMEIENHIAKTRELIYQLQDYYNIDNTILELRVNSWSGYSFFSFKNSEYDAIISVFDINNINYIDNYLKNYIDNDYEHEWDKLRNEKFFVLDEFSKTKSMVDPGTNGIFLFAKEKNIKMNATCEGHPHGAYIYFDVENENSKQFSNFMLRQTSWMAMGNSHFTMKNITNEDRKEIWRKTWDNLKEEFNYELPKNIQEKISPQQFKI